MGSTYVISRKTSKQIIKYRAIKYKFHGKWKEEILGQSDLILKGHARRILQERERAIALGNYGIIENDVPTLSEFTEEYISHKRDVENKRSWKKDQTFLRKFIDYFGDTKLCDITTKQIDEYKLERLKKVKAKTVNNELQVLKHMLNLAKKWNKLFIDNVVSKSGLIKTESNRKRILTYEEEKKLIENSSEHLKPIIKTALLTAMRLGELLSLRWSDVDLEQNYIKIRREVSKSKKSREIPISTAFRLLLLELKLKTGKSGYVFVTDTGIPYSPSNPSAIKRTFTTARRKSNLLDSRFHDLRHTALTRMAEGGC